MRARHRLLAVLTTLAGIGCLPAAAPAEAAVLPELHGIQISGIRLESQPDGLVSDLDHARDLGSNVVRSDIDWAELEPSPGQYDQAYIARADGFFAAARARGIKVLLTVSNTPCWNSTAPDTGGCATPAARLAASHWQPRDLDAFARAAAFTAQRWQADIAALEVWNEPDQRNELYWAGPDKVKRYADLVKTAYPAIKAASPSTTVLAGSMVGGNGKFLEALYQQGIQGSYDGLSVHYYDLVLYSLGQIRAMRAKYHDTTPLWLAEFGWTSCLTKKRVFQDGHFCVTRAQQARNTLDVLRVMRGQRDLKAAVLFSMHDNDQYDFGVLDRNGRPKPLYAAVKNAFRGRYGPARRLRLALRASGSRVVATGSSPAGDVLELDVWQGRTLRYRAAFRPDRNGRFALRLPAQLGRRGLTAQVSQVSIKTRPAVARL